MRDMTMEFGANAMGAAKLPLTAMTPEQELAIRLRLSQVLQISLDPSELLSLFYKHIQNAVSVSGLIFKFGNDCTDVNIGRICFHHCDYRLTTDEGYLGEISFSRAKRFAESELNTLELLLGSLVYPLRNALRYQKALRLALLDPLTMLGNRSALDAALKRELQLAERYQQDLSLLMIDVDYFKKINDEHGHHRGDMMLCAIAKAIESVCRGSDIIFRYGGEEFVVVLGKTHADGAKIIAERIRMQIMQTFVDHNGKQIGTTASIGIATRDPEKTESIHDLFDLADAALYSAKAKGRNCIVSSLDLLLS